MFMSFFLLLILIGFPLSAFAQLLIKATGLRWGKERNYVLT